jgi:hypothetical protein
LGIILRGLLPPLPPSHHAAPVSDSNLPLKLKG